MLDAAFSLEFLVWHEHILPVGPAGVGASFLVQALGYFAIRAGHTVRFSHADGFFKAMAQARVDNLVDRAFGSFLSLTCSSWTTSACTGSRPSVRGSLRPNPLSAPILQLRHHQQTGRG